MKNIMGTIPPQAIDMEEAVIGSIIIEQNVIELVVSILKSHYFYKEANQVIYATIIGLYSKHEPIDLLTVIDKLRRDEKLEEVGGPFYLSTLTSKVGSAAHVEYHARIVAEKYFLREINRYSLKVNQLSIDPNANIDEIVEIIGSEHEKIINDVFGLSKNGLSFQEIVRKSLQESTEREKLFKSGKVIGISTPIKNLTLATNGWQQGELIIVAARPSMGKTAFVLSSLLEAAKNGEKPCMFSLEMSGVRLIDRLLCGEANVMPEVFRSGCMTKDERILIDKAAGRLYNLGIYIDDNSSVSIEYIKNRCRVLHRKGNCSMIIIDYLQLIETVKDKNKLREQEVAELSRKAKIIAKELNVPVILLAQLNRSCESRPDKRPHLSDLRESGSIEQDADLIILIYRPEYYGFMEDQKGRTKGKGELIIAKQRNGITGSVFFNYNESLTRIFDSENQFES